MFIEIHALQSFPAANLNRDENGIPKSCLFGGVPRARVSSQAWKRAMRQHFRAFDAVPPEQLAARSRGWMPQLQQRLVEQGIEEAQAGQIATLTMEAMGAKVEEGSTNTILFLGQTELDNVATLLVNSRAEIEEALSAKKPEFPKSIVKGIEFSLSGINGTSKIPTNRPGEVALFGRMMASLPNATIDAAVQVAHAIGVNPVAQEFDFFSAVDDLEAGMGADFIGQTPYNGSTYYRYANISIKQLLTNLGEQNADIAPAIVRAFCRSFVLSVPSGKQNSFAAFTPPGLVMMTVRSDQPVSLANAFEKPCRPRDGRSLIEIAALRLVAHWQDLVRMYGDQYVSFIGWTGETILEPHLEPFQQYNQVDLDSLIAAAMAQGLEG